MNKLPDPLLFPEFPPVTDKEWEDVILADLKGADIEKKLIWKTYDGLSVKPFYRHDDLTGMACLSVLPGAYPYVRGNRVKDNHWEIRQDVDEPDPAKANSIALEIISRGAEGIGLDTSQVTNLDGLKQILSGINLLNSKIHFNSANSWSVLAGLWREYLLNEKIEVSYVQGSFNFDPLSCLLRNGIFHDGWESRTDLASRLIRLQQESLPAFKMINVNARHFQNAGSSLVQELGYGLAMANEYLSALTDKGFSIDEISPAMMFTFSTGSDYFPEIAKLRAARWLWSRLVEQYNPRQETSLQVHLHATTSLSNKTLYDPFVNLLRTTTETMAAALGGADSITTGNYDAIFQPSDEFSRRMARNQQTILMEESCLNRVIDPAAGSYYVEWLTDAIAREAWAVFRETEEKGGFISCFNQNFIQENVEKIRKLKIQDIDSRKTIILGTNQYPNASEDMLSRIQYAEVQADEETKSIRTLQNWRGSSQLEKIRLATEKHLAGGGKKPVVFLLSMGNLAMRKARATFAGNFFGCAGYHITDTPGFSGVTDGVEAALAAKAGLVVICSSDEEYPEIVPQICTALKTSEFQGMIVLAGYPKDQVEAYRSAGIHAFIHVRTPLPETLMQFHHQLGILP